ncbi:hypothetical protein B0T26DRAFT_746502 [Lasiosphaeria miniovina]|uniref:SET domain-containing protein n=1 Tax=Lasiosphaeria miniovina TaxID=1954250 RepID=A0AA40BI29_9PEZI|nr:uncharacterized protein B0T26DRAFT_746502 [Lasiosphaeria miniovina]KAK0734621.1 hypothetical protein B0T26DRAFT_746502 [Lasiosphaeria miniovina]
MAVVQVPALPAAVAAKALVGQPPPRKLTKEELIRTHKTHLKKQDLSPDEARPVKQPVLSEAYPASTKSIRDVEFMPLSELRVETHHRGRGVIVKVISPPYIGAGAVSIVEDGFGNVDKLAIYNQPDSSILSAVPEGCVVAVKEPYYKHNGAEHDYMICVDHPSDVVLLRFADPLIPEQLRLGPLLKSADEWRAAGDTAFIEKDLPTAVFCYTEALETSEDEKFKAPVFTKRAGTNLLLGRYDAAMADALASRTGGPGDWKAYYNAGRAAYGLCQYAASRTHLEQALELSSGSSSSGSGGIRKEHERCLARLREEEHGDYDFPAMAASLSPTAVHLDRGSFLRRTRVDSSPHHGRGLFATQAIAAGELVFVEKATLMPNQYEPSRASAALYAMTVRQLCDNPSLAQSVLTLYAGDGVAGSRTGAEDTIIDGRPVVDVFLVEGIRTKNCFSAPLSTVEDTRPAAPPGHMAKGLWAHASHMNHSCVPNTMRSFLGDMLVSRATRDIAAGEEVFQQYVPVKSLVNLRNAEYKAGWGFECGCTLCSGERKSPAANLDRRREVLIAVEKACNKRGPGAGDKGIVPNAVIRNIDRLAQKLEDLHEPEVYDGLPRLTLIYPCNWLVGAHRGRKNHAKVLKYGLRVLRNFGFRVPLEEGSAWEPRDMYTRPGDVSLMTIHVVAALRKMAEAHQALGQSVMAARCTEAAEFGFLMVTGFKNDPSIIEP